MASQSGSSGRKKPRTKNITVTPKQLEVGVTVSTGVQTVISIRRPKRPPFSA
jgi:hypothetical protein